MKLGITGSRSIKAFDFSGLFCKKSEMFRSFMGRRRVTKIICGGAKGVDALAEEAAQDLGIPVITFLPDHHRYQRGAPLKRNEKIIDACDALLAVWNGKTSSRGTIYIIKYALSTGKRVFLITSRNGRVSLKGEISADSSPFA